MSFEQAPGYSESNKLYYIKALANGNSYYFTTYPQNENMYCNVEASLYADAAKHDNQVWKIITKNQYYELAKANPAHMEAVIDFSFLMKAPDFRVNDIEAVDWVATMTDGSAFSSNAKLRFGDNNMYRNYDKRGMQDASNDHIPWGKTFDSKHQQNYGKLFYCYSRGLDGYYLSQEVQVHKAGWYVLRCNGFTSQTQDGKPQAVLFATVKKSGGVSDMNNASVASLNILSQDDAAALLAADNNGTGAGKAFFEGKYENQVQLCIDDLAANGLPVSSDNPVTLVIGYYVKKKKGDATPTNNDITAVDNFKLLYAGPRRSTELILDEQSTDLRYITKAKDNYTNTVLHLNRTLNAHQWNTFMVPVDLTAGQLKRTFGDEVKVAKLERIGGNTVFFVTEETANDDEVLVTAFEPYILYPPVVEVVSPEYTEPKFYTTDSQDDNSKFLSTDYTETSDESKALTKTIPANHYVITMVTLNRNKLLEHIEGTKYNGQYTWKSKTSFSTTDKALSCYGTLAKTYDANGIIAGRDDLENCYFMHNNKLLQVPAGKKYGLLGFRCWLEINDPSEASAAKLNIDGVEDGTTGIDAIATDGQMFTSRKRGLDGVYSLDGQLLRHGCSAKGLPQGIYIIGGRKVVISE